MSDVIAPTTRGRYFVENNHFVKEFTADVDVEFEKSKCLYELSVKSEYFDAPKPLFIGPSPSQVTYEFMTKPVISIREPYIGYLSSTQDGEIAEHLFRTIGRCLAEIHRELRMSTSSSWTYPEKLYGNREAQAFEELVSTRESSAAVFLHCDFGFSNIFVNLDRLRTDQDLRLWVIDASPNYFTTFTANSKGLPEIDIANLVACMHGLFPLYRQIACDWSRSSILFGHLISGYEAESTYTVNQALLRHAVELTLRSYMQKRVSNSFKRRLALHLLLSQGRIAGLYGDQA